MSRWGRECLVDRSGITDQHGDHLFTEVGVGHTDHRRFGDPVDGVEDGLDLLGVDVFAAGDDHVARSALQGDATVVRHGGDVAGQEPSVRGVGGGGCVWSTPVFPHDLGTAHGQHADVVAREFLPVVDDSGLDPGNGYQLPGDRSPS